MAAAREAQSSSVTGLCMQDAKTKLLEIEEGPTATVCDCLSSFIFIFIIYNLYLYYNYLYTVTVTVTVTYTDTYIRSEAVKTQ